MNADPIARAYRWIEYAAFGRALERCRFRQFGRLSDPRRVLMLGEGDGRFLQRFVCEHPAARIDVVDVSAKMIAVASVRLPPAERARVRFFQADVITGVLPGDEYDLVVTNFLLDCLTPAAAEAAVGKIAGAVRPGGRWIVSEFGLPAAGLRRLHAAVWLWAMYLFFRLTTALEANRLPDYSELLALNGFVLADERRQRLDLIRSQLWTKVS